MKLFKRPLFVLISILLIGCSGFQKEEQKSGAEMEQAFLDKTNNLGDFVYSIEFNLKTDDKEFEDGIIPWISIEDPESDLQFLIDKDTVVIPENTITVIIDYPLTNEYRFSMESKSGFTREQLIKSISANYRKLYKEEEKSATMKTMKPEERPTMNRNETNGIYGIWGHDIGDLDLSEIQVYKTQSGEIILSLGVES